MVSRTELWRFWRLNACGFRCPGGAGVTYHRFPAPLFLSNHLSGTCGLCLPRQFQLSFVELARRAPISRWAMPAYLAMFALLVIPMAAAGLLLLPEQANPVVCLLLPLSAGGVLDSAGLLGGLSGIAMIIAATMALSTMVCNEWVVPYYASRADHDTNDDCLKSFCQPTMGHRTDHVVGLYPIRISHGKRLWSTGLLALWPRHSLPSLLTASIGVKPIDMGPLRVCYWRRYWGTVPTYPP